MLSRLAAVLAVLWVAVPIAHAGDWELINEEEGIKVYSKEIQGSDIVAFKGHGVIQAPMQKLLFLLAKNERREEWVDRLYITETLQQNSPHDLIFYQAFGLPLFISNRDYVFRARAMRDAGTGVVRVEMSSVEHPDAPESVGVRANLINSRYVLKSLGPNETDIQVEIHTDPRGIIPTWLVNLIQKSWPLKTLSGLRSQVAKPYVREFPMPPVAGPGT